MLLPISRYIYIGGGVLFFYIEKLIECNQLAAMPTSNRFKRSYVESNTTTNFKGQSMPANSKSSDVLSSLRSLGLNEYQARAFHVLSLTGEGCTAGEVATKAQLPRPRVYDVLTSLQEQGFVAMQPGRPVKYAALPITEAVRTLKSQRQAQVENELSQIDKIAQTIHAGLSSSQAKIDISTEESVWTLKGDDAIHSKLASMLSDAKNHITIATTPQSLFEKLSRHSHLISAARKRGVNVHISSSKVAPEAVELATSSSTLHLPTRMVLADDQALLFLSNEASHKDEQAALWLKNDHVVQTLKQLTHK